MAKITKEEIIKLASRYVHVDKADFPMDGDLFYFLARRMRENKVLKENEGWQFFGYGQCRGYALEEKARPRGKWLFMYYLDLSRFPLRKQVFKLQPPHITGGQFFSPDRTVEFRIVKCKPKRISGKSEQKKINKMPGNIIEFPQTKK